MIYGSRIKMIYGSQRIIDYIHKLLYIKYKI